MIRLKGRDALWTAALVLAAGAVAWHAVETVWGWLT